MRPLHFNASYPSLFIFRTHKPSCTKQTIHNRHTIFFHKFRMFQPKLLQPSQIIAKNGKFYVSKPFSTGKYSNPTMQPPRGYNQERLQPLETSTGIEISNWCFVFLKADICSFILGPLCCSSFCNGRKIYTATRCLSKGWKGFWLKLLSFGRLRDRFEHRFPRRSSGKVN